MYYLEAGILTNNDKKIAMCKYDYLCIYVENCNINCYPDKCSVLFCNLWFNIDFNKNVINSIFEMFKSNTINYDLCECIEIFANIIRKRCEILDSKIYEYIPTDKCVIEGGIITDSEFIYLNGYTFQISDNFKKMIKEGLDVNKGLNSIYEQITKIISCNRPTKSARNIINK